MRDDAGIVRIIFFIVVGFILIYAVAIFLPWIVAYPVVLGAGSFGLGWVWYRVTRSRESGLTSLERLVVLIPASALVLGLGLYVTKPGPVYVSPFGYVSESATRGKSVMVKGGDQWLKKGKRQESTEPVGPNPDRLLDDSYYKDSWNRAATTVKDGWLSLIFPFPKAQAIIGVSGLMSFCHEHVVFLAVLMFLFGGPASFFVFFKKGWSEREHELISKNLAAESKFRSEISNMEAQRNIVRKKVEAHIDAKNEVIMRLKAEIERLKLRDRYLSEGKPVRIEGQVEKPDLGFL
jgi:hypothetical protein